MKATPRRDPIVEEMRAAGDRIALACHYDIKKFAEYFMRLQRRHPERLVNFEGRQAQSSDEETKTGEA